MKMDSFLSDVDRFIALREHGKAVAALDSINQKDIPFELKYKFAQFYRRLNQGHKSLRILWGNIYEYDSKDPRDLLEFANSARKLRLFNTALRILKKLPESNEKRIVTGFCYISQWRYREALEQFSEVELFGLEESKILSLKVNRASCLLETGRVEESMLLCDELIQAGVEKQNFNFYLNCLELKSHGMFLRSEYSESKSLTQSALSSVKSESDYTYLFIKLWNVLAKRKLGELGDDELRSFRADIRRQGHWETLRELDFNISKIDQRNKLAEYVYYGTPFTEFRAKFENLDSGARSFLFYDQRKNENELEIFDSHEPLGEIGQGQLVHRLVMLLLSDFYRPWSGHRLYDSLFPSEDYNPYSSHKKVEQAIYRLRKVLGLSGLEDTFKSTKRGYRFRPVGNKAFFVHEEMNFATQEEFLLHKITLWFGARSFSRKELQELSGLNKDSATRILGRLIDMGSVRSEGQGPRLVYRATTSVSI